MKTSLQEFLQNKNYTKVKLHLTKTNHFEIIAFINGVKGKFIIDTGASNSCVGFDKVEALKLKTQTSEIKAAGAGTTDINTQIAKNNYIKIGKWTYNKLTFVVIDLSHINTTLVKHNSKRIDGIIGADVLKKTKAIIDYEKKYLYLKL